MNLYQNLSQNPFVIAGPCVIESENLVMQVAEKTKKIVENLGFTYVFKASFDKANRTSVSSFRGLGFEEGLRILEKVGKEMGVPVLTDFHESSQAKAVGEVVDILQIPAFLCRQTDMLVAAGETGKIVNIKKAQFASGKDMRYPCEKVQTTGNSQIILTERGNFYGNNDLVVDYRNLLDMQSFGYPLVMDMTHSVQKPSGAGGKSGGNREYAPFLGYAAAAIGVKGFFIETHPEPEKALSDGANMIPLSELEKVLSRLKKLVSLN